ncbi:hypothetical protein M407DRAFT_11541, partial [Tulasnella calospora MUT 4182]
MHSCSLSSHQQDPHGFSRDLNGVVLSEDRPPRPEDQTQGLRSLPSEQCCSECFSAGLGPLCLKLDTEPDGKVQSAELVLSLGPDSQFTITAPGPFEDEEVAESFVLWKVLSEGIIRCHSSPSMERFTTTPAHSTKRTKNSYSQINSDEAHQLETWYLVDDEEVDQLEDPEEIDAEAPWTTMIEDEKQTRSRSSSPCTYTSPNCTANLYGFTQRSRTTSATFPLLFTRRYQHLAPNPYGPPLQRSYGPSIRSGTSRVPDNSASK